MQASRSVRVAFLAALVTSTLAASSASARADESAGDPGVARLSVLRGAVDLKRADSGDTYAAAVNAPISAGDYVTTGDDAHAEIEYTFGAALRVARGTQLRFTRLDRDDHVAQLAAGTVELRLFRGLRSHPEVATPNATVRPTANGRYRISVAADGDSAITVRSGRADVITEAGTRSLTPGNTLSVTGTGEAAQIGTSPEVAYDDFDRWNGERDAYVERTRDFGYVDQGIVGADDLDRYGQWQDSDYGRAWRPDVDPGWAPYNDGRWTWQPFYGWTWVAAEPWGWAPYHYGRWFYASNGWCWSPGVVASWPLVYSAPIAFFTPVVYQPALVAFFSFGSGFGGFGFGNIGWVPLAPYEPYRPWWGRYGNRTVTNVTNISNVTNVTNVNNYYGSPGAPTVSKLYRNAAAPGGAVAVKVANFTAGRFEHVTALQPADLTKVSPIHGILPVVPTTRNLAFTNRIASAPATGIERRFAKFAPPSVATRPFIEQQADIKRVTFKTYPHTEPALERPVAPERKSIGIQGPAKAPQATGGAHPVRVERIEGDMLVNPAGAGTNRKTVISPWDRFDKAPSEAPARVRTSRGAQTSRVIGASRQLEQPRVENRTHGTLHTTTVERNASMRTTTPLDPFSRFDNDAYALHRDRSFGSTPALNASHGSMPHAGAVAHPLGEPLHDTANTSAQRQYMTSSPHVEPRVESHAETHVPAPAPFR